MNKGYRNCAPPVRMRFSLYMSMCVYG